MASSRPSIRAWLREIDSDLEVYVAEFEDLGYNVHFLLDADSSDLEQDLKTVVKKVHLRAILKEHAKLKAQKLPQPAATLPASRRIHEGTKFAAESSLFRLVPCTKDIMAFQPDPRSMGSGEVVLIPIWCLRSIQGKVHSQMTFTSGRHKEASVYELIHDMLSGRQRPEQVEPLQVVVDEHGLHIVRGHRRGLALCALQGMWRHRTVLAPCRLYGPTDAEVAGQFVLKDTAVDGLGLQLHGPPGKYPEAWHRGKPLFRTAQEWCDSLPEVPAPSSKNPVIQQEQAQPSQQDHATSDVKSGSLQDSLRSATRSSGLVEQDHHLSSATTHNQEEAANAIHGEVSCENEYDPKSGWLDGKEPEPQLPQPEAWLATGLQDTCAQSDCAPEVCISMLVYVQCEGNLLCGEVLEVSNPLVKLRYFVPSKDEWISIERLLLPDYSLLQPGMEVTACFGDKTCACTVLDVSQSKERERLRAPVKVRHSGPGLDEWMGIDRLQLQHVKLLPVKAPKVDQSVDKTQDLSVSKAKEEHVNFLQAASTYSSSTATGNEPLKKGTMVCVKGSGSRMTVGEVLEMSWLNVVKVRYSARGQCHVVWFPLDRLKVPDFSNLKEGTQIHVEDEAGKAFLCEILQVSQEDKTRAPVYVHYKGYDSDYDEWVGADRIRSKLLILHDPLLQIENMKSQHPGSLNKQASQQTKLSTRLECQRLRKDSSRHVSDGSDLDGKGAKLRPLQDVPLRWVPKTEDVSACQSETSKCVCCFWLLGKCRYAKQHSIGKTLHLHKDVPGLQCGYGMHCWHKHFKRRSSQPADELPPKEPPAPVPAIDLPQPSPHALPWNELESETKAFESALRATEDALVQQAEVEQWQPELERTLAAVETECLRGVLEKHSWSGQRFAQPPQLEELLDDLNGVPGPSDEDSDADSDTASGPSVPPSNDLQSSCAAAPNDWEDRMARQPSSFDSAQQLPGLVVFGTFRSTNKDVWKSAGEVIVHRGPTALCGCRVKILGGKTRGCTWDYDQCYVRILDVRVWEPKQHQADGKAVDVGRIELFGRVVHAMEFGVPRQKLFVCVKPKVVHNSRCVSFKPINGKLPAIQVPWNTASALPNSHDLHMVEVLDWSGDRCPRGQYLEDLKMSSRHSDTSILEAVQISLNFCDWLRGDPRSELAVVNFQQPPRRGSVKDSGLTVGIQHPGLPTSMLMSCGQKEFYLHVLDVNAYLDAAGMERVEELLRRRSVGVWFLDHLDSPLDASLPLFPPNIEEELTFKAGVERAAMTFTIQVQGKSSGLAVAAVQETTVRCDHLVSPQEAGAMILSEEGGEVGKTLRRINSHGFEGADFAELLLVVQSIPGPLLATERLLQGCMRVVDRYVGATLTARAWNQILKDREEDPKLTVRYHHGRADPRAKKVIERLLRINQSDWKKEVQRDDVMRTLGEILQQPGFSSTQKHACRYSFLRRLHAALPAAYYEVTEVSSGVSRDQGDWWHPEPRFHVASPLHRYIDILGMRAFKCQLGWTESYPHMLLSHKELKEAVARTNCRMDAETFGLHIFRTISRMRQFSGSGQKILDAVIGGVGPKYIHVLVPSQTTHTLELQVPVSSLCSATCVSEFDAATHSIKLIMQNGRDPVETLRIHSWCAQPMTCVISRNYAQPIPHHASAYSIVVWEIRFHGDKDFVFPTGLKSFPESFSSWPDLTDWPMLDRKVETYSQVWSRIKLCQVHAAAVSSDAYSPATAVNDLKWFRTGGAWHFECQVDVELPQYRWVQEGDLVILSSETGEFVSLQGTLVEIGAKEQARPVEGKKTFTVEVELSKVAELAWQAQDFTLDSGSTWHVQFISIHPNEKKSIQLLQDMPRSSLLQGMRLTLPRNSKEMKREMEMRPLVTIGEVKSAMESVCSTKLNEKQTLAVQRGLQRPFSMVQGPPGTGKTSFLVQCVAALLSAPRQRKPGDGRILVCAPSNHAVDHILDRLISAGTPPHYVTRIYSRFIERYHGSKYKGGTTKPERSFWIQPHLEQHALHWKVSELPKVKCLPSGSQETFDKSYEDAEVQVLRESRIVITTCTTAYLHTSLVRGEPPHVVRPVSFDSIVIDEAAQASEPDIVLSATSASNRVIVVGDHKQLGPVVTENNLCTPYVSALETPFLERMYQNPRRSSASTILNMQYRMHPSIRSFPSSQFYESKLEDQVSIPHRPLLNCIWPKKKEHRCFVDCQTPQSLGVSPELTRTGDAALMENKVSLKNVGEARSVVAACSALLRRNCEPRDIAVITPYKAQQDEIRARLERDRDIGSKSASILVGTVHALQGCEREYIIVSFVRSTAEDEDVVTSIATTLGDSVALQEMYGESLGILKNYRVLNVAITRAKYGFICVGNADVLSKGSKDFHAFIHSLRSCKCIVSQKEFLDSVRPGRALKQLVE